MATTVMAKIKVQELTKYGFKANDKYVNYSKQFTDQAKVVPGAEFDCELYVADSGKEYLNKIISQLTPTKEPLPTPPVDVERAKKFTPKFNKTSISDSNSMSKADWAAKDRNMMIGGRSHDAAVIVASLVKVGFGLDTTVKVLEVYKELLNGMLTIAGEVK